MAGDVLPVAMFFIHEPVCDVVWIKNNWLFLIISLVTLQRDDYLLRETSDYVFIKLVDQGRQLSGRGG